MNLKVRVDFDFKILEVKLGYHYNIIEGGYVSPNGVTIIIDNRQPYIREVMQFTPNDVGHGENVRQLIELDYIEVKQ